MHVRDITHAWLDLPNHVRPFGGQIVIDSIREHGGDVVDYDGTQQDSTILLSLYWCEDLYEWVRFRKRNSLTNARVIIGGNHATGSPAAVLPFCAGVYRGDGDDYDGIDATHLWTADNHPEPRVCNPVPRRIISMEAKAVAKVSFPIMELSRGCKYQCHYCQYAWMKPYREQDADWLISQVQGIAGGRVRLSSADIPQHSRAEEIFAACKAAHVGIANQDGALFTVARRDNEPLGKMQRFGIDGMSDRLRKMVHKPIKADWLVERIATYAERGVTRCLAYNIFGLPTETSDDYAEWDAMLRRIVETVGKGFTWVNSWNAFLPMPMTPLASSPSSWRKDHRDLSRMADTRKWAKSRGVNVFDMPERTGDRKITERMIAIRATEKTAHIVATIALRPSWNERDVLREFKRCEGYDLHGYANE